MDFVVYKAAHAGRIVSAPPMRVQDLLSQLLSVPLGYVFVIFPHGWRRTKFGCTHAHAGVRALSFTARYGNDLGVYMSETFRPPAHLNCNGLTTLIKRRINKIAGCTRY